MIIKRRFDYEEFCGMGLDWIQLWQVGKSVYRVENMFKKQWWIDLYADHRPGRRFWAFRVTAMNMVKYYGTAPTVEELAADAANCDAIRADTKRMMKEQGFYEFFDKCRERSYAAELFNEIFGTNITSWDLDDMEEIWRRALA